MTQASTDRHPISRFPVPTLENLPDDIRQKILDVQEKAGFVPNVFLTFAHRPDEFRAFFAYHDALLLRDAGPGGLLRIYERNPLIADQVATNYLKADITPRQKAMLGFAMKVCNASYAIV